MDIGYYRWMVYKTIPTIATFSPIPGKLHQLLSCQRRERQAELQQPEITTKNRGNFREARCGVRSENRGATLRGSEYPV